MVKVGRKGKEKGREGKGNRRMRREKKYKQTDIHTHTNKHTYR